MIVLRTARLYLRQWQPDDWLLLRPIVTDPRMLRFIGRGEPWPDERIRAFVNGGIEAAQSRGWLLWPLIHTADERLIGFCGFNNGYPPDVEIGWWIAPAYQGRSLATEAARAVMDHGFRTFAFPRLISVAQPQNAASIRVMEKLGMVFERSFEKDGIALVAYVKYKSSAANADVAGKLP